MKTIDLQIQNFIEHNIKDETNNFVLSNTLYLYFCLHFNTFLPKASFIKLFRFRYKAIKGVSLQNMTLSVDRKMLRGIQGIKLVINLTNEDVNIPIESQIKKELTKETSNIPETVILKNFAKMEEWLQHYCEYKKGEKTNIKKAIEHYSSYYLKGKQLSKGSNQFFIKELKDESKKLWLGSDITNENPSKKKDAAFFANLYLNYGK